MDIFCHFTSWAPANSQHTSNWMNYILQNSLKTIQIYHSEEKSLPRLNTHTFQRNNCTAYDKKNCLKPGQCTKYCFSQNKCSAFRLANQQQKATGKGLHLENERKNNVYVLIRTVKNNGIIRKLVRGDFSKEENIKKHLFITWVQRDPSAHFSYWTNKQKPVQLLLYSSNETHSLTGAYQGLNPRMNRPFSRQLTTSSRSCCQLYVKQS